MQLNPQINNHKRDLEGTISWSNNTFEILRLHMARGPAFPLKLPVVYNTRSMHVKEGFAIFLPVTKMGDGLDEAGRLTDDLWWLE